MMQLRGKKLLILGANDETAELVKTANSMGVITVVTDYTPEAPAKAYADIRYDVNAMDVEALAEIAEKEKIDGVMVGVAEVLIAPYRELCSRLSLPCYASEAAVKSFTNKRHMKEICRKYDIYGTPEYRLDELEKMKFPVVVKPEDGCSSKGITVCYHADEVFTAIERAKKKSKTGNVLIERFMNCDDLSIYYVFQGGKAYLATLSDRYTVRNEDKYAPICVGDIFVSKHYEAFIKKEHPKFVKMFEELGIHDGVLYFSAFYENERCYVYDPGFRMQGGGFHIILDKLNGIDNRKMLVEFALTGKCKGINIAEKNDPTFGGKSAAVMWVLLRSGKIKSTNFNRIVKDIPDVFYYIERFHAGDEVNSEMIGTESQVYLRIFIAGESREELRHVISMIRSRLQVVDENDCDMISACLNEENI